MLWQPPEDEAGSAVDVDPMLTRWLRPHQREGTQFMFDCVCGLRSSVGQGASVCHIPHGAEMCVMEVRYAVSRAVCAHWLPSVPGSSVL